MMFIVLRLLSLVAQGTAVWAVFNADFSAVAAMLGWAAIAEIYILQDGKP